MTRKLTTEEFIAKAVSLHGTRYDYSSVTYSGNRNKVEIGCVAHGVFSQSPSHHLMGKGCKKCAVQSNSAKRYSNTAEFVEKCLLEHGDKYDYSSTVYVSARGKVKIGCRLHSLFEQTPNDHLCGAGCPKCGSELVKRPRLTTKDFINTSKSIHGNKYDYSQSVYTLGRSRINIVCREHGEFSQIANAHMAGKGCQKCMKTGYQTAATGKFYILSAADGTVKVGITNRDVKTRARDITYSSGKKFSVVYFIMFEDGHLPTVLEGCALKYLSDRYSNTPAEHDGHTECFTSVDVQALISEVSRICCNTLNITT